MRKKISLFIVSYSGSPARQITASRAFFSFLMLLLIAALGLGGYMLYDYGHMRTELFNAQLLEKRITRQTEEIEGQRQQIQRFATRINTLKSKIVELNDFEQKIRVIAGIDEKTGLDGVFGVGGSVPDDLDPKIPLAEKHSSLMREMSDHIDRLSEVSTKQRASFEDMLQHLEKQVNIMACTPSIRPTRGWITSRFGWRNSPFTGLREFHKGLDIATQFKTPIITPADGKVTFIGNKGGLGKVIVIDHGYGITTRYGHINKALKKRGESVKRGDVIALVGKSGRATGSHLHYEVLLNGIAVNPQKYILN